MMLDRIRACISALPPAEQRVARLVLADARGFATLPVGELADRAGVSKPTVVRFCRSVGYDGLADFKRKLAGSVNEGVPFVHRAVDDDDGAAEIVVKVIDNAVSAMLKYRNAAAGHAFERAIAALAEAGRGGKRIEFYGVGNSGRSRDLLDVCELALRKGATVIVISASGSPLALLAQGPNRILLAADHPEDHDRYSPMVSRLLHLLIIDILTTGVALRLGSDELRPLLQEIKRNLRTRRYASAP